MGRGRSFTAPEPMVRVRDDRDWSSPAYQRPEVMPEHPGDVASARGERMFVEAKRRAGVSWNNIGRMTGKSAADLQRKYGA